LKLSISPYLSRKIHGVNILWFNNSNEYILLNDLNNSLLSSFIKSKDFSEFYTSINLLDSFSNKLSKKLYSEFNQLLNSLQSTPSQTNSPELTESSSTNFTTTFYNFNNFIIKVCYQSKSGKKIIHPQFSFLEDTNPNLKADCTFYIKNNTTDFQLFKNRTHLGTYPQSEYHLLQGKFAMELLCSLTGSHETEWLGTFHASTISNNKEAVMLVGESGKGKSTLATILMANGYNLIADDFTPIMAKTQKIHHYPSAISMKKGSFHVLESLSDKITFSDNTLSNIKKGDIKYVVPINTVEKPISCKKIILVAYNPHAKTSIKEISAEEVLNILIPDSWISPEPENAECFLNWLEKCEFYKLTYHDSEEVISEFNTILEK